MGVSTFKGPVHNVSYGSPNLGSFSHQKVDVVGQKDAVISQSWYELSKKNEKGYFVPLETSYPVNYVAPINCPKYFRSIF